MTIKEIFLETLGYFLGFPYMKGDILSQIDIHIKTTNRTLNNATFLI